jgi:SPP1 gp7 family putative phage head morphogenesis protein
MDFLFNPAPATEAVAFIRAKAPLKRAQFEQLLPELQALAFTVSGVTAADALQDLRDTVATLPEGVNFKTVQKQVAAKLATHLDAEDLQPLLVDLDPEELAAKQAQLMQRARFLVRHHGNQAYAVTAYQDLQEHGDIFPFWKYLTVGDGHVRDTHRALDGLVLPKDHEFWQTHFPPWEFGCRCQVVPVTEGEYKEYQKLDEGKEEHERQTLTDAQLEALTNERAIQRSIGGVPTKVDLRAPRERMIEDPYIFDPGVYQIPLETLRARYDAPVWAEFEKFARGTKLPSGSLWQWLGKGRKRVPKAKPIGKFPDSLANLKVVQKLGGSTGAELVEDEFGRRFVRKLGKNAEHLREEFLADDLYRALGVPVPEAKLYEEAGRPVKLAEFVRGKSLNDFLATATQAERDAVLAQVRGHFMADALLANYDVAGMDMDNILVDAAGVPWRIDNGGSLRFRAQGAKKAAFGPVVTELQSMLDPKINPSAARLFAGLTDAELRDQLDGLLTKRSALLALAPDDLRDTLSARLDWLEKRFIPRSFTAAFAGEVQASRVVGKTWIGDRDMVEDTTVLFWQEEDERGNPVTRAKLKLTHKGSDAIVATLGDDLRRVRPVSNARRTVPGDVFWSDLLPAVKHVNAHVADGKFNPAKLAALDDLLPKLDAFAASGDAAAQALAASYKDIIIQAKQAMAAKKATPQFSQYEPPAPQPSGSAPRSRLDIRAEDLQWKAKSRDRGFAKQQQQQVWKQGAYRIGDGDAALHFVPWTEATGVPSAAPYAFRGYAEITLPGAADEKNLERAASLLREAGVDIAAAPRDFRELLYLRKNLDVQKFPPATDKAWRAIADDAALDDAAKLAKLKAWTEKKLKLKLTADRWQPDGRTNSFGQGWQTWDRLDLTRDDVEKEMAGHVLHHTPGAGVKDVLDSILEGGGVFTPTTERMRIGVPITTGMSPTTDLGTGGANYLFTRIKPEREARHTPGFAFKVGNLARLDAYSFGEDRYGDVRPAGETSRSSTRAARGTTVAKWKSFAHRSGNETIFKWGLPLLDEVQFIKAGSKRERDAILQVFARHKYTTLPDGRKVEDIVIE